MLILSRKRNQSVVIGGDVRVTILKTQGDSVRVGIEAPPHITVHRDEVHARIVAEELAAQEACTEPNAEQKGAA